MLWLQSVRNLAQIDTSRKAIPSLFGVFGRELDIFTPTLSIAHWLEYSCGCEGLFDRMSSLFLKYNEMKSESQIPSVSEIIIFSLRNLIKLNNTKEFTTSNICDEFKYTCRANDITDETYTEQDNQSIGNSLRMMKFESKKLRGQRGWIITRDGIEAANKMFGTKKLISPAIDIVPIHDDNLKTSDISDLSYDDIFEQQYNSFHTIDKEDTNFEEFPF